MIKRINIYLHYVLLFNYCYLLVGDGSTTIQHARFITETDSVLGASNENRNDLRIPYLLAVWG